MVLLLAHLISTWFMTGLIWLVQIVHYPLFTFVDKSNYTSFQNAHMLRIGMLVIPVMSIELITGLLLIYWPNKHSTFFIWNAVLLVLIWILTFGVFTFIHGSLRRGYDGILIRKLVLFNWIRTGLWSFRSVLLSVTIIQS